jgi:DNA-binding MarR family transcriptional regulator
VGFVVRAANENSSWREAVQVATLKAEEGKVQAAMTLILPADVVLVQLSFLVQSIYADVCVKHGLSPAQAQLLCVIKDRPRGMTELTRILGMERPGLSGLVDRVQQRGLVERQGVPHDRRAVMLAPTPGGKRIAEDFHAEVSDRLQHLVADLPAAERRRFETIGSKVLAAECVPAVFGTTGQDKAV